MFDGQWQFGQYPRATTPPIPSPPVWVTATTESVASGSGFFSGILTPGKSAIFLTVSSDNFVDWPPSNMEMADCWQPRKRARADWFSPFALRASLNRRQISVERFVTADSMRFRSPADKGTIINRYQQTYHNMIYKQVIISLLITYLSTTMWYTVDISVERSQLTPYFAATSINRYRWTELNGWTEWASNGACDFT